MDSWECFMSVRLACRGQREGFFKRHDDPRWLLLVPMTNVMAVSQHTGPRSTGDTVVGNTDMVQSRRPGDQTTGYS